MNEKAVETDKLPFGVMIRINGVLYIGKHMEEKKGA